VQTSSVAYAFVSLLLTFIKGLAVSLQIKL